MVTDALLGPLLELVGWMLDLLPTDSLDLPDVTLFLGWLGKVNSIVPIGPVVGVAVAVLSTLVVFVLIRAALTVWHIVWP